MNLCWNLHYIKNLSRLILEHDNSWNLNNLSINFYMLWQQDLSGDFNKYNNFLLHYFLNLYLLLQYNRCLNKYYFIYNLFRFIFLWL